MEKIKSPIGRVFIHVVLILFAIYSLVPFFWTTLQSFKTLKDANSRTPKIFFSPTWDNYQDLWLRSVPENGAMRRTGTHRTDDPNRKSPSQRAWLRVPVPGRPGHFIFYSLRKCRDSLGRNPAVFDRAVRNHVRGFLFSPGYDPRCISLHFHKHDPSVERALGIG